MAKSVHFVEQRILSGNDAWVIHHFGQSGDQRVIAPGQHLVEGEMCAIHITSLQSGNAGTHLQILILLRLFGAADKPGESFFAHHIDDFMRIAHDGGEPARQRRGFKGHWRHHAGFNVQVSVDKAGYRCCAVGVDAP